jgi:transcriptional regulator with XRE-family HTH domain
MDDIRTGARFRALRLRLGWRQLELAAKANVSQGVISLVERGRIEDVTIRKLRRIAHELDAEFSNHLRWRGGDLDRLLDEGHAYLVGRTIELLRGLGWEVRAEVSFSVYGERGSIDILAWHPGSRSLLVIEVKTAIISLEETVRKHDQKARLASRVASDSFGWQPANVSRLVVLPDLSTARRRVDRHAAVLSTAYPARGSGLRGWLRVPTGALAGLMFIPVAGRTTSPASGAGRKRVRLRASGPGTIAA